MIRMHSEFRAQGPGSVVSSEDLLRVEGARYGLANNSKPQTSNRTLQYLPEHLTPLVAILQSSESLPVHIHLPNLLKNAIT